ncbi:unnamed protein product, partial [Mesorhabditis spiculigera]
MRNDIATRWASILQRFSATLLILGIAVTLCMLFISLFLNYFYEEPFFLERVGTPSCWFALLSVFACLPLLLPSPSSLLLMGTTQLVSWRLSGLFLRQFGAVFEVLMVNVIFLPLYFFYKQKGTLLASSWNPLDKLNGYQRVRSIVEERYVWMSHFFCNSLALAVTKLKVVFLGLFAIQFLIVLILLFGQISAHFILARRVEVSIDNGTVEFFANRETSQGFWFILLVLFSTAIVIGLAALRNLVLLGILIITLLNSVATTGIVIMGTFSLRADEAVISLFFVFLHAFDTNFKYCLFYKGSRRGSRASRSLAAFHLAISSLAAPNLIIILFLSTLLLGTGNTIYAVLLFACMWDNLLLLFKAGSLLAYIGPTGKGWLCQGVMGSGFNSEGTDKVLSVNTGDPSRRLSSVNYPGMYKKRVSLSIAPSARRASMPVVALANSRQGTPGNSGRKFSANIYQNKRGMSIDGASLPGSRSILRREPLLFSQQSLNSQQSQGNARSMNESAGNSSLGWGRQCFGSATDPDNCPYLYYAPALPHLYFVASLPFQYIAFRMNKRTPPSIPLKIWARMFLFMCLMIITIAESADEYMASAKLFSPRNTLNVIAIASWTLAVLSIFTSFSAGRRSNGYVVTYSAFQFFLSIFLFTKEVIDTHHVVYYEAGRIGILLLLNFLFYGNDLTDEKECQAPYDRAGFYSRLIVSWLTPLIAKGYNNPLNLEDLHELPKGASSEELIDEWDWRWKRECGEKAKSTSHPSIASVLFAIFKPIILPALGLRVFGEAMNYVNPLLLKCLIDFVNDENPPLTFGIMCAIGMFAMAEVKSLINVNTVLAQQKAACGMQSILSNAIFRKSLRLSPISRGRHTVGEVVNFLSVDVELITSQLPYLVECVTCPLNIAFSLSLLSVLMGPTAVSGIALMLLLIPFNYFTSVLIKKLQLKQLKVKDERAKICNEVLNGIKLVKLYAWEPVMLLRINKLREQEVNILRKANMTARLVDAINAASPYLVAMVTFTVFILSSEENILTPQIAFVALAIFNQLRLPMKVFALLINYVVRALVSKRRIEEFLVEEELEHGAIGPCTDIADVIQIEKARLNWLGPQMPTTLTVPSLTVKRGEFVAVVGAVGAGKSSFLNAIMGELCLLEGSINVSGELAYSSQQPWLRNETLKNNILFGKEHNSKLFRRVIEAVRLNIDFEQMDLKEYTEVGDNGVTLSGGQKARVGLARALYQEADVYLLDDVLSAVDAHVGASVFHRALGREGFLRGKTRILVTHGLNYTKHCDRILVIKDGQIVENGTYSELLAAQGTFATLLTEHKNKPDEPVEEVEEEEEDDEISEEIEREKSYRRLPSAVYSISDSLIEIPTSSKQEAMEEGSVSMRVYGAYMRAASMTWTSVLMMFFVLQSAFAIGRSLWLAHWTSSTDVSEAGQNLAIFSGLGIVEVLALIGTQVALVIGCQNASLRLHSPLLHSVLRSPMSFFDTTPVGRILNRLTRDLEVIDNLLPTTIGEFLNTLMLLVVVLVMISIVTPMFMAAILPIGLIYFFFMRFFIRAARQLRRLESVRRSPLISLFGQSVHGASTIRAYKKVDPAAEDFGHEVDNFIRCRFLCVASNSWLSARLEAISAATTLLAALCGVFTSYYWKGQITPADLGMSISYALNLTEILKFGVRMMSELETYIVSVERVDEYSRLEAEAEWRENGPTKPWPSRGNLQFRHYSTRYRSELPLVIQGLTLNMKPGEKIGVVGRTGSGKSSLTMALYRIIEAHEGQILIDDVDISSIGLHDLREKISIIPQEPILFSGSFRFNMDPFERYTDDQIWAALETCQLKNYVTNLPGRLEEQITEGGSNMSVGQRQLVCLGRALLRGGKILVLDEATAACDVQTDALVQRAVRDNFPDSTVIAIAHRLDTIEDYDRILVMDGGQLKEFDTPKALLDNPHSLYRSLVEKAKEEANFHSE